MLLQYSEPRADIFCRSSEIFALFILLNAVYTLGCEVYWFETIAFFKSVKNAIVVHQNEFQIPSRNINYCSVEYSELYL